MKCELCDAEITNLMLVDEADTTLPGGVSGVATLTSAICALCWTKLGKPPSCVIYRGRILALEDISPLDMRPVDLNRLEASVRVSVDEEMQRAEDLKTKLNRMAVLTFHDPFRRESVVVHRDDWTDPIEIAVALVEMVRSLRGLGSSEVDEILARAGVTFSANPEAPTE